MTKSISSMRFALAAAVFAVASVVSTSFAHAQIAYQTQLATTTNLFQAIGGDLVQTALVIIGIVMGISVFIFVVFWGWRRLRRAMNG